jgi:hypothetical protein
VEQVVLLVVAEAGVAVVLMLVLVAQAAQVPTEKLESGNSKRKESK